MAHVVKWSPQALADIEAIAEYIERDSPFYAKAVVTKIIGVTRQLSEFPLSGRVVPEMKDSTSTFAVRFGQYLPPGTTDIHKQC